MRQSPLHTGWIMALAAGLLGFLVARLLPTPPPLLRHEPQALVPDGPPQPIALPIPPVEPQPDLTYPPLPPSDPGLPPPDTQPRPRSRSRAPTRPVGALPPAAPSELAVEERDPRVAAEPAPPAPDPPTAGDGVTCRRCGLPAAAWVERDGTRIGLCSVHAGAPERPLAAALSPAVPSPTAAPAPTPEAPPAPTPPPAASERASPPAATAVATPSSRQCRGITRAGSQCRRKTRHPSGLCHQHQTG